MSHGEGAAVSPARSSRRAQPGARSRAAQTRAALVDAGRTLFSAKGYYETGTHEIVAAAKVTRGALQYHFPKKRDLFVAVYCAIRADLTEIGARSTDNASGTDGWLRLLANLRPLLDTVSVQEIQRVLLQDGPAVLGWKERRDLEAHYGLGRTTVAVGEGIRAGHIRPQGVWALSHLLHDMLSEAVLLVANAERPAEAIAEVELALRTLMSNMNGPLDAP